MTSKFTNFDGDNLDNFLGHEMIDIKENYVKSKLNVKDHHKQPMGLVPVSYTHLTLPTMLWV